MRTRSLILVALAATLLLAGDGVAATGTAASAPDAPLATPHGITVQPVGRVFYAPMVVGGAGYTLNFNLDRAYTYADASGMTLYTFADDQKTPGKSSCTGECASLWPAALAPAGVKVEAPWSLIDREDGQKQWALRGQPLYRYAKDTVVGHDLGRGLDDNKWKPVAFEPVAGIQLPAGLQAGEVADAQGHALMNEQGRTLYAFSGDLKRDTPKCGAIPCRWQPVFAPELAAPFGDFTIVTRSDQTRQWAYRGKPLFTHDGDFETGFAVGMGLDPKMNVAVLVRYFMPPNATLQPTISQGLVLADAAGKTLYRRDGWAFQQGGHGIRRGAPPRPRVGREIGTSMEGCDEQCRPHWHPFVAPEGAQPSGFWEIATRDDGTRQWVYKGYALYTYDGDQKPGDLLGTDQYDYKISMDPAVETKRPTLHHAMGAMTWLYAFP